MLRNKIDIRFAVADDLQEIAEISRSEIEYGLGWKYTKAKLVMISRQQATNIVVAKAGSELLGFGLMTYKEHNSNLDLLATKPKHRRQKIASKLVNWLNVVAYNAGIYNVFVQVRKGNTTAIDFYESLDFAKIDEIPGYYQRSENAVIMVKALRPLIIGK